MFDFENEQNLQILRDLDHFAMALLIKILERKTLLVNELKHFNDLAEKKQANSLREEFYEDFGWIVRQFINVRETRSTQSTLCSSTSRLSSESVVSVLKVKKF
jgi:tRNA-dihydrouridine synthase